MLHIRSVHAKYSASHHMVIKPFLLLGLAAEYRSRQWVWSTVVPRPSEVYDTHWRTKLTAPEMISHSRDKVPGLSYGVVCDILHLAILIQYGHVTDRWTDRQTQDDSIYSAGIASSSNKISHSIKTSFFTVSFHGDHWNAWYKNPCCQSYLSF